ncbi:hypothetical protein QTO34_019008 [Cnephaeus nilssonii]|uniref:RCC1-like domain-containing protein n=1 Tax=Cnephaeus nilssonii TaxID=3371016 RepID=A0AA40LQM5_CNENI|nr:hypothetical protein QTO34_019008 [Eptesicus nilssonii]
MPRKKAAAAWEEPSSGNGTARAGPRKRGGPAGRKRERPERCSSSSGGGSSGDEDGLELDGAPGGGKRAARPAATKAGGAAVVITEPEHTKERVVSAGSEGGGGGGEVRPAARHARSGRGGGAGAGHGLNHHRRRRRPPHNKRARGGCGPEAGAVGGLSNPALPVRAAVGPGGARPGPPGGGGASAARARPPARGGHGPAPGAARADRLRLPSPSRPGKGDFCKLSRTGVGDARAGPDVLCPRLPPASCGRRSARAPRRRGLLRAAGSGGLRLGFEVPAASAPALRGGGAWWPPRMPLTALHWLSRRRGDGGGRRWGGRCSGTAGSAEEGWGSWPNYRAEMTRAPKAEVHVRNVILKIEGSKCKGQLLIFGATNWDLIGRKEVPKQQAAYRNLGQNLWGPHRYGCLSGVRVRTVVSGSCAAHSLLITTEGKLWSWGRNEKGQLGHGDTKRVEAPRLIEGLSHEAIVSAACGRNHTLALTETGSVFAFGENKMGSWAWQPDGRGPEPRTGTRPSSELTVQVGLSPAQIMYNGQPITKMACGAEFSMIMDCKGNLYSFGCPEYGQLGHNSDGKFIARAQRIEYDCELVPRRVAIFIEKTKDGQILPVPNVVVRDVACGANHTLVLDSQKRVFSWGFGGYGRLGHAEQKDEMVPRLVKLFDFPGRGASQIYAGYTCSFAVSEVGGLFFWGATNTSRESTMYPKTVQDLCGWRIRSLACGYVAVSGRRPAPTGSPSLCRVPRMKSSIIVAADESTISWGPSPTFGELGYGDHKPKSSTAAQEVKTLDGIFTEQVAMGYSHSLVIARDESETEKEKIKKLPEYNPRTL